MNNKRRKYKRNRVPGSTIALYIGMVVVILGICAVVFFVSFNALNKDNGGSSSSSSSSGFILPGDESSSPLPESSSSSSSTEESSFSDTESSSSDKESSSSKPESSSSSGSSSSSSGITEPTNFSKEFFKDDLFIGDSIFTGLYLYDHIEQENVAAKVGYTPYGAINYAFDAKGISALNYAKQRNPKRIFIMLGANAMSSDAQMDALKNSYSNLLTTLKSELPNAKICCISITPVARKTDYPNIKIPNVKAMNDYIKQQCKALNLDYYDFCSVISDDEGYLLTKYAEVDGFHYKSATYKVMLSALQKKYS